MPGLSPCRPPMNARSAPDPSDPSDPSGAVSGRRPWTPCAGLRCSASCWSTCACSAARRCWLPTSARGQPWWDRLATGAVTVLAEGRFYPLFSFLLGYGFTVAYRRAQARGDSYTGRHLRRSAALFALGALHAALLFSGDILSLVRVARVGIARGGRGGAIPALLALAGWLLAARCAGLRRASRRGRRRSEPHPAELGANRPRTRRRTPAAVSARSPTLRLGDWGVLLLSLPMTGLTIGAAMLVGHWSARRRLLEDPAAHAGLLRRLVVVGLPLGLAGAVAHALSLSRLAGDGGLAAGWLGATGVLNHVAGGLLTGAYIGIAGLFFARRVRGLGAPRSRRRGGWRCRTTSRQSARVLAGVRRLRPGPVRAVGPGAGRGLRRRAVGGAASC